MMGLFLGVMVVVTSDSSWKRDKNGSSFPKVNVYFKQVNIDIFSLTNQKQLVVFSLVFSYLQSFSLALSSSSTYLRTLNFEKALRYSIDYLVILLKRPRLRLKTRNRDRNQRDHCRMLLLAPVLLRYVYDT